LFYPEYRCAAFGADTGFALGKNMFTKIAAIAWLRGN
jgi:hypothetical protein